MKLTGQNILLGLVICYAVVISIMMLRKAPVTPAPEFDVKKVEAIKASVDSLVELSDRSTLYIDSLRSDVARIQRGVSVLQTMREQAYNDYKSHLESLNGLSIDSLKQIALQD